jgi:adenylylsulfate kinase
MGPPAIDNKQRKVEVVEEISKQTYPQSSFVIWLTGLPSSGKTTIAGLLKSKLNQNGLYAEQLDGDVVRKELSPDLGFTKHDRDTHARRVVYLCKLLCRNGVPTIVSLISPYRDFRSFARNEIGSFVEVYVKCSLGTCIQRDVKGLYKKALNGEINDLTGLQDPYEEPLNPEIVVNTELETLHNIADKIILKLNELGYIRHPKYTDSDANIGKYNK